MREGVGLYQACACGEPMKLALKTVIFARKVNITNVPVYACKICGAHKLFSGVRKDVSKLLGNLGSEPAPGHIPFDELHEWAGLIAHAFGQFEDPAPEALAQASEDRINELLDLWLLASSLGDDKWKVQLEVKLSQLSSPGASL